jgi:hypothetical protein
MPATSVCRRRRKTSVGGPAWQPHELRMAPLDGRGRSIPNWRTSCRPREARCRAPHTHALQRTEPASPVLSVRGTAPGAVSGTNPDRDLSETPVGRSGWAGSSCGIMTSCRMTTSAGALYDVIGQTYSGQRRTDSKIAARIWDALGDAETVLNVGAGTESYEPSGRAVTAVEPSAVMRAQRPHGATGHRLSMGQHANRRLLAGPRLPPGVPGRGKRTTLTSRTCPRDRRQNDAGGDPVGLPRRLLSLLLAPAARISTRRCPAWQLGLVAGRTNGRTARGRRARQRFVIASLARAQRAAVGNR